MRASASLRMGWMLVEAYSSRVGKGMSSKRECKEHRNWDKRAVVFLLLNFPAVWYWSKYLAM